ncbi:Aryl hydrocarbon receptor nuclear translocator-like protein 1 [Dufourea novaeangliae]|uniref:Aryl hydrocarbon receptor nuclear translocator-like protein 1 n=1 Tax=Dufourea novaeangliae TaxID=178035 RepID=A0A154P0Z1_DUFNO|nr:Aryl hydrocarbon receptor nuclear translocator-like protein 1 [Dufourea novaeangliae]
MQNFEAFEAFEALEAHLISELESEHSADSPIIELDPRNCPFCGRSGSLSDEGGLLADTGGVVESCDGASVNVRDSQSVQHRLQQQRQEEELEELLCFCGPPAQEMVAQEMAPGYTHLLHSGQEPQEFISLEALQPRVHQEHNVHDGQVASMTSTGGQLYQQRSYYNLSAVQEDDSTLVFLFLVDLVVDENHPTEEPNSGCPYILFLADGSDLLDDTGDDAKSVRTNDDNKKQNHSEIEKRRRDKMNTYITELSAMIPMCHAMSRKLDKLTVLRMAVQHLKTILGAVTSYTEGHYKPAIRRRLLMFQAAEGFVFVVGCDRGRILYVSESVLQTLNYSQGDLLGQSWFDILHPKDVAKVKEQLSSSDLSPRERLIDAKTMLPVKTDVPQGVSRLCPGARRSFFCRMKRKVESVRCGELQVKEEADTTSGCHRRKKQQNIDWKYCVIQCTGYLKSWAPAKIELEEPEGDGDGDACNLSCLVAVGRLQSTIPTTLPKKPRLRPIKFVSRHAMDGKFLFVDQRATLVLGFLPQELLSTSMYEYYHHDDIPHLAESHKAALQASECVTTQIYKFRTKGASFVKLQSEWKSFRNPWTKDIEYLIAKNSVTSYDSRSTTNSGSRSEDSSVQANYDYFTQSNGGLERLISSHIEVSKIGRQIAEEVLDLQRRGEDSSSGSSPGPGPEAALINTESQITTTASPERVQDVVQVTRGNSNSSSNPTPTYNHIASNLQLNSIANDQGTSPDEDMMEIIGGPTINESPNPVSSDGNDEAAMAVIMSLLEADAGLGGPVDFSGLPWPLP